MFFAASFFASAVYSASEVGVFCDPGLLEEVGAVRHDARPGVVRHAVGLAVEHARSGEALQPVRRVRERRLLRGEIRERAGSHVLRHLRVAHLDDVGCSVRRECGVELLQMVGPVLVLHGDVPAGMRRLELRGCAGDRFGPPGLRVDLEPHGEVVGGALLRRVDARACRRGRHRERDHDDRELDGQSHSSPSKRCWTASVRSGDVARERPADPDWFIPLGHRGEPVTFESQLSRPLSPKPPSPWAAASGRTK